MCKGNAWIKGLYKSGSKLEKTWIQRYNISIGPDTEMLSKSVDTALYFWYVKGADRGQIPTIWRLQNWHFQFSPLLRSTAIFLLL